MWFDFMRAGCTMHNVLILHTLPVPHEWYTMYSLLLPTCFHYDLPFRSPLCCNNFEYIVTWMVFEKGILGKVLVTYSKWTMDTFSTKLIVASDQMSVIFSRGGVIRNTGEIRAYSVYHPWGVWLWLSLEEYIYACIWSLLNMYVGIPKIGHVGREREGKAN